MLQLKQMLISLLFLSHSALKLVIQALRFYLKLICEYELHISPNTKVNTAKDHGDDYMKVRPPFVHHLLRNRLLDKRWQTTSDFCVIFTMCLCSLKVPMKKKNFYFFLRKTIKKDGGANPAAHSFSQSVSNLFHFTQCSSTYGCQRIFQTPLLKI